MKITRSNLKRIIETYLKEAPLAWGEDEEGNRIPSIVVPGSKEEKEEFIKRSDEVPGGLHVNPEEVHEFGSEAFEGGQLFSGAHYRGMPYSHDKETGDMSIDYLREKYKSLYLRSGYVSRVDRQLKKFPIDVHFVLLPHFVGPKGNYDDPFSSFYQGLSLRKDKEVDQSGQAFTSEFDLEGKRIVQDNPGYMRGDVNITEFADDSGKTRQFVFDANDANLKEYNNFIKDYIKEKTGAIVKPDDLVVVNFVTFRNIKKVLTLNDFEKAKKYIDSIIGKRFNFIDSIYLIFHSLFDSGPMAIPSEYDLSDPNPVDGGDEHVFSSLFQRLSKYDSFFNIPYEGYSSNRLNFPQARVLTVTEEEFAELQRKAAMFGLTWKKVPNSNQLRTGLTHGAQQGLHLNKKDYRRAISLGLGASIVVRAKDSKSKKIISPLSSFRNQSRDTSHDARKSDTVATIIRDKRDKDSQSKDVRSIFNVKTIRKGTINSGFDFYAEMCNVAFLADIFPINVAKIKNSEILNDNDKDWLLRVFVPYFKRVYEMIKAFRESLKGKFIYGSASDLTRFDK
jgi:hypothetical protein